jgi:hypothetical protein
VVMGTIFVKQLEIHKGPRSCRIPHYTAKKFNDHMRYRTMIRVMTLQSFTWEYSCGSIHATIKIAGVLR